MTDESLARFNRNRRRLPRKQRQHESSSKTYRQLVKRNPPSSSGGIDLRVSSSNTFTRNGSKPNTSTDTTPRPRIHNCIMKKSVVPLLLVDHVPPMSMSPTIVSWIPHL
ncbi:unnamed protein product [Protopolystoma xenopodis]|uniref:Uncharacterized protein n=1 Tax=Protopolystoma xenopodis TaxID=117903 RepID=A0A3S5CQ71_9PLAT|nr:unnamed protein product [Protopolystoma xenopodis]